MRLKFIAPIFVLLAVNATMAHAAFIVIDDSNVDTITITAGDFEDGFFVDGDLLTSGLFNSGSITFADGEVHEFSGSWIDLGETGDGSSSDRFFGLDDIVYSGVEAFAGSDGGFGVIFGAFVGFDPFVDFGLAPDVNPQDGSSRDFSFPFSRNTFISEAVAVPEPETLGLLGAGLLGLGVMRRKRVS